MNNELAELIARFRRLDETTTRVELEKGRILRTIKEAGLWQQDFTRFEDVMRDLGIHRQTGYNYLNVAKFVDEEPTIPTTFPYRLLRELPAFAAAYPLIWQRLKTGGIDWQDHTLTLTELTLPLLQRLRQTLKPVPGDVQRRTELQRQAARAIRQLKALGLSRSELLALLDDESSTEPTPVPAAVQAPATAEAEVFVDDSTVVTTPAGDVILHRHRPALVAELQRIGFGYDTPQEAEKLIDKHGLERVALVTAWTQAEHLNGVLINGKPIGSVAALIRRRIAHNQPPSGPFATWLNPPAIYIPESDLAILASGARLILDKGETPTPKQMQALRIWESRRLAPA